MTLDHKPNNNGIRFRGSVIPTPGSNQSHYLSLQQITWCSESAWGLASSIWDPLRPAPRFGVLIDRFGLDRSLLAGQPATAGNLSGTAP